MTPGDNPPDDEDNDNRVVYHARTPSPVESIPSMSSDEGSLFEDSEGDETVEDRVPSNERAYEQGANYEDVGYDYITGPRDRRYRERPPYTGRRDSRSPPPRREPERSPRDPDYEANRHTYSPQPPSSSEEEERPRRPSPRGRRAVKAKNRLSPGQISMLKADRLRHGKGPHPLFSAPPPLRRDDDDAESSAQHPQAGPSDIWQGRHPNPRPAEWERQADSPNRHSPRHRRTWGFGNVNRHAAPSSSPPHRRPPYRSPSPSRRPEHRRYSPTPEHSPPDHMRSRRSSGRYSNHEATDSEREGEEEGERNKGRREYSSSNGGG